MKHALESPVDLCYITPLQYPFNSSCNTPYCWFSWAWAAIHCFGRQQFQPQLVDSATPRPRSISAAAKISVLKKLNCGPIFARHSFRYGESCPGQSTCLGAALGILMPACAWIGPCLRSWPLARFLCGRLLFECAACEWLPLQTALECDGQGLRIHCLSKGYGKLPHLWITHIIMCFSVSYFKLLSITLMLYIKHVQGL
jgi:hypothetical protein